MQITPRSKTKIEKIARNNFDVELSEFFEFAIKTVGLHGREKVKVFKTISIFRHFFAFNRVFLCYFVGELNMLLIEELKRTSIPFQRAIIH